MGLVTQEDPIGIAGGLNLYGYANGDPINFSDPFGLNPLWIAFEIGASIYDAIDLAVTGARYLGGTASGEELSVTAGGAALGLVTIGGGAGRAARSLVREGVSDARLWKKLAFEELLTDAQQGLGGRVIAGAGHARREIDDIGRLVGQYGGEADEWAKMAGQTRHGPGGIKQQVHWYENRRTGQRVEFKPANEY